MQTHIKEDLSKKDVYLPTELVDLGTATKQKLKALGASKDQKIKLQNACSSFFESHCGKDATKMSAQISCGEKCLFSGTKINNQPA